MNSIRTSASVMVLARPSMRTTWPASGSATDTRQVCTMALSVIREATGVAILTRSGKDNVEGEAGVATHGRLEENIEAAEGVFAQVQIGRTDFVSEGLGRREQASKADQNKQSQRIAAKRGARCRLIAL